MWQTIGQPSAVRLLENSLKNGNLHHAYLFAGPAHVGKTTLALDLARYVNCVGQDPPCAECHSCRRIINGNFVDLMVINLSTPRTSGETKKRTEIGIDDIRDIQQSVSLPPYEGKHRVIIIETAELLSIEASNALLKTLEEPPPNVVIILLTTDEARLLPTVASRCQRIELKPISIAEVERILVETQGVPADTSQLLARLSEGCLGWAITASCDAAQMQQRTQKLSELIALFNATLGERFTYVSKVDNDRKNAEDLIKLWLSLWRDLLLTKCNCQQEITHVDYGIELNECAQSLSLQEIKGFIDQLGRASMYVSLNANVRLVFEVLMLEMPGKEEKAGHAVTTVSG